MNAILTYGLILSGNPYITLTAIGALVGIVAGVIIGRFNVYYKLNRTNNFVADEEYGEEKISKSGSLFLIIGSLFFLAFGIGCLMLIKVLGISQLGTLLVFAMLFMLAASIMLSKGINGLIKGE